MTARRPPRFFSIHAVWAIPAIGLGVYLLSVLFRLAVGKEFSVDEFEYGHGAWLISQGEVIYRDFWEAHFPLVHQVMSVPFLLLDDDPTNLVYLRVVMLAVVLAIVVVAAYINRRWDPLAGWITPLVLLGITAFASLGVEVRPDTLSFAIFLAAVAVLHSRRPGAASRGLLAGGLVTLACWGSQKVFYYGLVVVAAFVVDLVGRRRRTGPGILGDPRAFVAGSVLVLTPIALYLTVTRSWGAWFEWAIRWSFLHQQNYPGFPWIRNFLPFLAHHTWLFVLAGLGVWAVVHRRRASDGGLPVLDLLLLGLLATTFASAAWQTASYLYSFLPFMIMLGLFAARGLTALFRLLAVWHRARPAPALFVGALAVLLLVGELVHVRNIFRTELRFDNGEQLETLRQLGELTAPGDAVFDIAGRRVTRPGVHFFYFTDAVIRDLWADTLAREIPTGIVEHGAAVYLHDPRFPSLPASLRSFLVTNFQPLNREIWLWGRHFRSPAGSDLNAEFPAVRDGEYFLHPAEIVAGGRLSIDGTIVDRPALRLEKGVHEVEHTGGAADFYLLWRPRDGRTWRPAPHPVAEDR